MLIQGAIYQAQVLLFFAGNSKERWELSLVLLDFIHSFYLLKSFGYLGCDRVIEIDVILLLIYFVVKIVHWLLNCLVELLLEYFFRVFNVSNHFFLLPSHFEDFLICLLLNLFSGHFLLEQFDLVFEHFLFYFIDFRAIDRENLL